MVGRKIEKSKRKPVHTVREVVRIVLGKGVLNHRQGRTTALEAASLSLSLPASQNETCLGSSVP